MSNTKEGRTTSNNKDVAREVARKEHYTGSREEAISHSRFW